VSPDPAPRPAAPPLPPDLLQRLDLVQHLPPFGDPHTVDAGNELHARVVAALSRPILSEDGTLIGTAGHMLLDDLAAAGGRDSPASGGGGGVPWTQRAQVVFHLVDSAGQGWVDDDECEALARAFLTGAGGTAEGPLKDYLEDLSDEGAAILSGAVKAEAAAMMEFAEGGRLTLKGFSMWLAAFMEGLEEDAAVERAAAGEAGAATVPPPRTPAGPPPYSLTPETMDETDEGGDGGANSSGGALGSVGSEGEGVTDLSAEEARAIELAKASVAAWAAAQASEPTEVGNVWEAAASNEPTALRA
jgi:hypothetical protein